MNRFTRKLVSLLGIAAVLFAQLAVSAHACPMQLMGPDMVADTAGAADENSGGTDTDSPALCQKHCEHAQQSVNDNPQTLAFVTFEPAFEFTILIDAVARITSTAPSPALLHPTSPPLSIRNCCFRI